MLGRGCTARCAPLWGNVVPSIRMHVRSSVVPYPHAAQDRIGVNLTQERDDVATDAPRPPETNANHPAAAPPRAATGIAGLDVILGGGVLRRQMYLIEGAAGTGKTTLAMHFLLAGRDQHERCLWITTAETPDELRAAAHAHGWSLEGIEILALPMVDRLARPDQRQTLFRPAHVELDETMQEVLTGLERVQPERVVLDSLALLRDMADEPLAYRRQVFGPIKQTYQNRNRRVV